MQLWSNSSWALALDRMRAICMYSADVGAEVSLEDAAFSTEPVTRERNH